MTSCGTSAAPSARSATGQRYIYPKFIIRHEGDTLTVKLEQQPTLPMKAIGPAEFEITRVAAKIRFNLADSGKARSITLFQGGQEIEGLRKD